MQYLRPSQLLEAQKKCPLVFLPLGPLEWHGPHMPLGTDSLNAETAAVALAERLGGIVLPTLYMGTEDYRDAKTLESLGFASDEKIVGMDFPDMENMFNSFYFSEKLLADSINAYISECISHNYKYIFIVNGHGAVNHNRVLKEICQERNQPENDIFVDFSTAFPASMVEEGSIGHAAAAETSLMMYYNQNVDLDELPEKATELRYADYAIVDAGGFDGNPGEDFCVPEKHDPRFKASAEKGEKLFLQTLNDISSKIITKWFSKKDK